MDGWGKGDVCVCVVCVCIWLLAACWNVRPSHLQTNEMSIKVRPQRTYTFVETVVCDTAMRPWGRGGGAPANTA